MLNKKCQSKSSGSNDFISSISIIFKQCQKIITLEKNYIKKITLEKITMLHKKENKIKIMLHKKIE